MNRYLVRSSSENIVKYDVQFIQLQNAVQLVYMIGPAAPEMAVVLIGQ